MGASMFVLANTVSMWELVSKAILSSSPLEMGILIILIVFSIVSWAIIFMKLRAFSKATKNNQSLLAVFENAEAIQAVSLPAVSGPAPMAAILKAGQVAVEKNKPQARTNYHNFEEKVHQRMQHTAKDEFSTLRWGLGFLASVASASPFIGLFGTVWGIMATFQNLGDSASASLAVVAPGISAALIATAAGLAVAIPAVMAYNALLARLDEMQEKSDMLIERVDVMLRGQFGQAAQDEKTNARASATGIPATANS
jgi:biopolymer transport protein ExbB/TolQ